MVAAVVGLVSETRLVRGGAGFSRIHKPSCRYAVNVKPWNSAEDHPDHDWLHLPFMHACRTCLPDLARKQDIIRGVAA